MLLVLTVIRQPDGCVIPEGRKVFGSEGGTIGRSADNTWHLPDPRRFVSSMHGFIRCDAGRYFMVDTSTNGIFVNGDARPIGPGRKVCLNEGDRINIGQYEFVVELNAAGNAAPPPSVPPAWRGVAPSGVEDTVGPASRAVSGASPREAGITDRASEPALADTAPVARSGSDAEVLMQALGIDPAGLSADQRSLFLRGVAEWIRVATRGTMEVLGRRQAMRQHLRLSATSLKSADNNPLTFSPNEQEALLHMFSPRGDAYLAGAQAIGEALADLADHERAVDAAMRAAFRHMLLNVDPSQLEQRFERSVGKPSLLQSRKAYLWEAFEAQYREWSEHPEQTFEQLFGDSFADSYQDQMELADLSRGR